MLEPIHPKQTRKRFYRYQFTAKHHGGGKADNARWSEDVTRDEEFSVFDEADVCDVFDNEGRFYGVLRDAGGKLRDLGTWQQQMAEFPRANDGIPWHGYPIWAVNELAPGNRASPEARPAKEVFARMELARQITKREGKRLYKGDHA
ncbi:MAG: hypothetical protein ACJ8FY_10495 [Gemmataceae bacterium]